MSYVRNELHKKTLRAGLDEVCLECYLPSGHYMSFVLDGSFFEWSKLREFIIEMAEVAEHRQEMELEKLERAQLARLKAKYESKETGA